MLVALLIVVSLCGYVLSHAEKLGCDHVNVFIGSGGSGFGYGGLNPAAQYPFGALRLGPDTTTTVVDLSFSHFSGYHYQDNQIRAFSHTHLVGAGTDDFGNIGVMPVSLSADRNLTSLPLNGWWSTFDKQTESGSPGAYSVYLSEPQVQASLLAIDRFAGVHRYSWTAQKGEAGLIVDVCHAGKLHVGSENNCLAAKLTVDSENPNRFTAAVSFDGSFTRGTWIYLAGEITTNSKIFKKVKHWEVCASDSAKSLPHCSDSFDSTGAGFLFGLATFGPESLMDDFAVELRVGLSFISEDSARNNLDAALSGLNSAKLLFDTLQSRTRTTWCNELSSLSVESMNGDDDALPILYSAQYRSMMTPTIYTESNGLYIGLDGAVHNAAAERETCYGKNSNSKYQFESFSDFSLWDTFRTLHPWQLLTNEDLSVGIARSLSEMTVQQSAFPRWPLAHREASCMMGESGASFIVDAISAGLAKEMDVPSIQKNLLRQLTESVPVNGRPDVENYMTLGYVTEDSRDDASSQTLTNAFDDFLLGKLSQFVGDDESASQAFARSKNYKNIWSSEGQYFCPRYASGEIVCPNSPTGPLSWQEYREGDALHWMWFVPHDVDGLIGLFPSPQAFNDALSEFFEKHVYYQEKFGSVVPNPYFWAGNEHDFMAPYLFNYGPNCTNTQYWSRRSTFMHYSNTPHGVPGNEDYGSMATWLLFSSLGIFPNAGSDVFLVSAPRVQSATVKLSHWDGSSSKLEIVTHNNSPENTFVEKLLVNGVEYQTPFIMRSVLSQPAGVKLEFFMQATPASGLCH